jgi:hypothetical protein
MNIKSFFFSKVNEGGPVRMFDIDQKAFSNQSKIE